LLEAATASAVAAIGRAKVDRALAAGAAATPRGVFAEVQAVLDGRAGGEEADDRVRGAFGRLTGREMDVLRLLAEARSDSEIAAALAISPKTSSVHVANIKSKLGVETRMEAGLRARELLEAAPARPPDRSRIGR
jgi:DNA-binding NarL/FixJ family response regulator